MFGQGHVDGVDVVVHGLVHGGIQQNQRLLRLVSKKPAIEKAMQMIFQEGLVLGSYKNIIVYKCFNGFKTKI